MSSYLGSKTATKPKPPPTWGVGKLYPAPLPKSTSRSYMPSMSADKKEALETLHKTREEKHALQRKLNGLSETEGAEDTKKALQAKIKVLDEVIKNALAKITPK